MRELYTCVEYALGGKSADVFGGVKPGDGFELLRRLARKFDPVSPQAASIFKGRIYGLAGTLCATFAKTVERLRELERMRSDMRDQTGEDMDTKVLAEIYFPTMDASCQSEIVALRIKIGVGQSAHDIDIANFDDLCEYVRDRIHREKTLVPIAATKMDVSRVETGAPTVNWPTGQDWGAQEGQQWGQAFGGESNWNGDWLGQDPGGDLDAFNKGKGKGKGDRKPIDCHRCKGLGHPQRLCPSPVDPPADAKLCDNCKGRGHLKAACPSPGGPKFLSTFGLEKSIFLPASSWISSITLLVSEYLVF